MPKRLTTEEFIDKSLKVHGNRYDYSLVKYEKSNILIDIICKVHGVFHKTPNKHLLGQGCFECKKVNIGRRFKKDHNYFINKSIKVHGDRYDYSKSKYMASDRKLLIICKDHGGFMQTPSSHTNGQGCPKCGKNTVSRKLLFSNNYFINRAIEVHGGRYDYSKVKYNGANCKVIIKCRIHGYFSQKALNHLQGQNCFKCSLITGGRKKTIKNVFNYYTWRDVAKISKNFDSFKVYIIKCWDESEEFYKVGKTFTTIKIRFRGKKEMPYNYKVVKEFIFKDYKQCSYYENRLKQIFRSKKYIPKKYFAGITECFGYIDIKKI